MRLIATKEDQEANTYIKYLMIFFLCFKGSNKWPDFTHKCVVGFKSFPTIPRLLNWVSRRESYDIGMSGEIKGIVDKK